MSRLTAYAATLALAAGPLHAQAPSPGKPDLAVAAVTMTGGVRVSKLIGANVYGDGTTVLGTVDDLIVDADHKVALAIVAVGGVLGVGAKLVALPIGQLQTGVDGKLMLPGSTKDTLGAMPAFTYGG